MGTHYIFIMRVGWFFTGAATFSAFAYWNPVLALMAAAFAFVTYCYGNSPLEAEEARARRHARHIRNGLALPDDEKLEIVER